MLFPLQKGSSLDCSLHSKRRAVCEAMRQWAKDAPLPGQRQVHPATDLHLQSALATPCAMSDVASSSRESRSALYSTPNHPPFPPNTSRLVEEPSNEGRF